ncbi:acetyl-CoA carboxylase biotin carboxyl carrier protein [Modicisalibacter muralis]|nr:biotin/lipoyl-containing protein [Halomonas muralis]
MRILQIIDETSDVEVRLEIGDLKLHVQKGGARNARRDELPESATAEPSVAVPSPQGGTVAPKRPEPIAGPELVAEPEPETEELALEEGTELVRAPMFGCFFRAPTPLEPPYIELGAEVGQDDPVCLLEVMKVYNTVRAGVSGTIIKVLVEDQQMVEQDQPLFVIKTS